MILLSPVLSFSQTPDELLMPTDGSSFDVGDGSPTFSFRAGMPGWHYYWISSDPDDCDRNDGDTWHDVSALAADEIHNFTIPSSAWDLMGGIYYWHTVRTELGGGPPYVISDNCWSFIVNPLDIQEAKVSLPKSVKIWAYPNPFNSSIKIDLEGNNGKPEIVIFDIYGHKVKGFSRPKFTWCPEKQIHSGLYLIRARIGEEITTKEIIYLK